MEYNEMTAKKNIMTAIKRAASPMRQSSTGAEMQLPPIATGLPATTPFTRYVLDNLNLQNGEYKLFAMTFAPQIQTDCDAKVLDFDDYFHLLGTEKRNALRVLNRTLDQDEVVLLKSEQNSVGRPRDVYLLSVNQIEEVLLAANTEEGRRWRKLVLRIKNLVVGYMKLEMEASAKQAHKQLEEQTSKLAIEEAKRAELEVVQARLQSTIESQRKRDEKKEARKRQQKQPTESTYLISNNPGGEGPFKCGMTEKEAKQRAKAMQTGNHEPVVVLSEIPCVKAEVIEKVMHQIFYDYRTNDKLEWFDAPLPSMKAMTKFLIEAIDGFSRIDHDRFSVENLLEEMTNLLKQNLFDLPLQESRMGLEGEEPQLQNAEATSKENTRANRQVKLDILDQWLVDRLVSGSLPSIILSRKLANILEKDGTEVQPNWVTNQLKKRYGGTGIKCPQSQRWVDKERGRAIVFDAQLLRVNFIRRGLISV